MVRYDQSKASMKQTSNWAGEWMGKQSEGIDCVKE